MVILGWMARAQVGDVRNEINPGFGTQSPEPMITQEEKSADLAFFEEAYHELAMRQRPWRMRYALETRWLRDTNVRLAESGEGDVADTAYTLSPLVQFLYGSPESRLQWATDYRLTATFFDVLQEENAINHLFTTRLQWRTAKLSSDTSLSFRSVRGGDLDVGGQAQRDQWLLATSLQYQPGLKLRLGLMGTSDLSDYQALAGFQRHLAGVFTDYLFSPKFSLGAQVNQFWDQREDGADQTGRQYLARLNWLATSKLTLDGSFGWEQREAQDYSGGMPVFSLSGRYAIGPKLGMTFSAYRNAALSPVEGDRFFYRTGAMTSLNWQAGERWSLALSTGVEHAQYETSNAEETVEREDQIWFVRPNVQYRLGRRISAEVFYQHTVNDSVGADARSFERDLLGAGFNFSF